MAEGKVYLALLNGLGRKLFFHDPAITSEYLKAELYPDAPEETFAGLLGAAEKILTNVGSNDMDMVKLERFLAAQVSKKSEFFTEEHAKVVAKYWKAQRTKIQDHVSESTCFHAKLADVSWRVDVKAKSRRLDELNTPVGLLEMKLQERGGKDSEVVRVELDRAALQSLDAHITAIEAQIKALTA